MSSPDPPGPLPADYQCFGCSPHNPGGLQLVFEPRGDGVCSQFRLGRQFESYPGIVHGGIVGVICDETMANLIVLRRRQTAFTVSMRQRFITPLAIGRPYVCVARFAAAYARGRLHHAWAEVLDEDGVVCATATASYQPFTLAAATAAARNRNQRSGS
jgi:acyl-coenzyme A thioesterase PaaI-like protein